MLQIEDTICVNRVELLKLVGDATITSRIVLFQDAQGLFIIYNYRTQEKIGPFLTVTAALIAMISQPEVQVKLNNLQLDTNGNFYEIDPTIPTYAPCIDVDGLSEAKGDKL